MSSETSKLFLNEPTDFNSVFGFKIIGSLFDRIEYLVGHYKHYLKKNASNKLLAKIGSCKKQYVSQFKGKVVELLTPKKGF